MLDSIYFKIWQRVFPKYPCTKRGRARVPETYAELVCDAVKDEKRRDVISACMTSLPQADSQEMISPPGSDLPRHGLDATGVWRVAATKHGGKGGRWCRWTRKRGERYLGIVGD